MVIITRMNTVAAAALHDIADGVNENRDADAVLNTVLCERLGLMNLRQTVAEILLPSAQRTATLVFRRNLKRVQHRPHNLTWIRRSCRFRVLVIRHRPRENRGVRTETNRLVESAHLSRSATCTSCCVSAQFR